MSNTQPVLMINGQPVGQVGEPVKTKTVSGTTNANGNLSLGLTTDNVVVQVTANGGCPCMPWVYNGEWSVLVGNQSGTSFNTSPNTSVTLKVYYI